MKRITQHFPAIAVIVLFFLMALASAPPRRYTYTKPVTYPCVEYAPLRYSPILLKINIDANYNIKDLSLARETIPGYFMDVLVGLNYSYKLADGVTPNLVLYVTFNNDGYNHFGVTIKVDWQGQANFTFSLPTNYVTEKQLITDMAKEFNRWVTQGWHSGNCK